MISVPQRILGNIPAPISRCRLQQHGIVERLPWRLPPAFLRVDGELSALFLVEIVKDWPECKGTRSSPGHLEDKWGFAPIIMKAKPRGVYERRVFCSEDAIGSVDMTENVKLRAYQLNRVQ